MIIVTVEDPAGADAVALLDELSDTLARITGDPGRSSFDPQDVRLPGAAFVVARAPDGRPVGCGAIRPLGDGVAELKRMFARPGTQGVGSAVLRRLEGAARDLGYAELWLSTRVVNARAVAFYARNGYRQIAGFGKYAGSTVSICMSKHLGRPASSAMMAPTWPGPGENR